MNSDLNHPKWTAYAFDELDASDRAALEVELRDNPEAREFVVELCETARAIRNALSAEPKERLTPQQLAAVVSAASEGPQPVRSSASQSPMVHASAHGSRRKVVLLATVAASLLIVVAGVPLWRSMREPNGQIAAHDSRKSTATQAGAHQPVSDPPVVLGDRTELSAPVDYTSLESRMAQHQSLGSAVLRRQADDLNGSLDELSEVARHSKWSEPMQTETELGFRAQGVSNSARFDKQARPAAESQTQRDAYVPAGPVQLQFREESDQILMPTGSRDVEKVAQTIREIDRASAATPASREEDLFTGVKLSGGVDAAQLRRKLATMVDGKHGSHTPEDIDQAGAANEAYELPPENAFEPVATVPLSTFSIDVDTASYSNVRRFLMQNNQLPPPAAVRIEEMVNYFRYEYPQPEGDVPFSVTTEVATCPWNAEHRLLRVGLKGREVAKEQRPVSNLVFLLDVSGSMQPANKLPLVREAMKMLTGQLSENDRVAIVVYAGASGLVLDSTTGDQKDAIIASIDNLQAGGSTNGAGGLQQAYDVAVQNFIKGGTNRVILATDGDFNVGITDRAELVSLIEEKAKSGVFLTTLGFGMGNLKDATLEQLADKGNGNYAYVDTLAEARKVFVEELAGTLVPIAKDVKLQLEFNPAEVESYRLIGYENRRLAAQDFNDDKKDAGEIGAGHTVTALYELVPKQAAQVDTTKPASAGAQDLVTETAAAAQAVDPLRYQKTAETKVELTDAAKSGELLTLKLRYKAPDGDTSKLIEHTVKDTGKAYRAASGDFKFAASVAAFGMTLRRSPHRGAITLDGILELAQEGQSFDPSGYRAEFVTLINQARSIGAK